MLGGYGMWRRLASLPASRLEHSAVQKGRAGNSPWGATLNLFENISWPPSPRFKGHEQPNRKSSYIFAFLDRGPSSSSPSFDSTRLSFPVSSILLIALRGSCMTNSSENRSSSPSLSSAAYP